MKVQLNSDPSFFPKALDGIERGFGLYSSYQDDNPSDKHINFISKFVEISSKLLSKIPGVKLRGDSKVFLERSAENIVYLKEKIPASFTKDLMVQLNVATVPTKVLKSVYDAIQLVESNEKIEQIKKSLSNKENYMQNFRDDFELDFNGKGILVVGSDTQLVFFKPLVEDFGIKKFFDFAFFHEASHHIDNLASKEFNTKKDLEIEIFLNKLSNMYKLQVNKITDDSCTTIKHNIAESFRALNLEVYADTMSFLMIRNREIEEEVFNQEDSIKFINCIKDSRAIKPIGNTEEVNPQDFYFTHATANGMIYLQEKIKKIEPKVMTLKEMDILAKDVQSVAIARTIVTLKEGFSDYFIPQLNTLACLKFNGYSGEPYLDKENISEKYMKQNEIINEIAGLEWVTEFESKVTKIKSKSGDSFESDIIEIGFGNKEEETQEPIVINKLKIVHNMLSARESFLLSTSVKPRSLGQDKS